MVLARLSEWTLGKEKEKRRPGPSPILQLCLGGLLLLAAAVPGDHLYRESSGLQAAQDPVVSVIRSENGETLESAVVRSKVKTDPLNLNSHSAVLLDGDTGRILYGKNEMEVLPMASTTKIMTCILALENAGLIVGRGGDHAGGEAACERRGEIPTGRPSLLPDAGIPQ